jgi:hypothetical protein
MFGWVEICILSIAALLLIDGTVPRLRPYRSLFLGGGALMLITAVFPRAGNPLGQFLFESNSGKPLLPRELFGIAWWVLGAWLVKSLLDLSCAGRSSQTMMSPTPVVSSRIWHAVSFMFWPSSVS